MPGSFYISELMAPDALHRIIQDHGCGLELIAFGIADNLDRFEETMRRERSLLSDLGNPPCSIHGPFLDLNPMSFDSRIRQATMDRFSRAYEAAQRLGAGRIVFHSGMIPTVYYLEGWAERMAGFWNEFLDGKSGITVCMENVLDREVEPFAQVAAAVESPDFGICLDLGHAHCYSGATVLDWLDGLEGSIRHLHLHDNDGTKDAHRGIGLGTIPYEKVLRHPVYLSADVSATVECADEEETRASLRRAF